MPKIPKEQISYLVTNLAANYSADDHYKIITELRGKNLQTFSNFNPKNASNKDKVDFFFGTKKLKSENRFAFYNAGKFFIEFKVEHKKHKKTLPKGRKVTQQVYYEQCGCTPHNWEDSKINQAEQFFRLVQAAPAFLFGGDWTTVGSRAGSVLKCFETLKEHKDVRLLAKGGKYCACDSCLFPESPYETTFVEGCTNPLRPKDPAVSPSLAAPSSTPVHSGLDLPVFASMADEASKDEAFKTRIRTIFNLEFHRNSLKKWHRQS